MKIGYLMQAGAPDVRRYPLSGPANHVIHTIKELQNLGHQVELLAYQDGKILKSIDLQEFNEVKVHWLDYGPSRLLERLVRRVQYEMQLPYAAWFESLRFALACRQELADCDLYYERMGWVGYGGGLASKWLHIPLIFEVNGDHLSELESLGIAPQGPQRWLSTKLMKWATRQVSHVVSTGEGWRQRYIKRWGITPSKITAVENGTELVDLLNRKHLRAFSPDNSIPGRVEIIYVGAFQPWHGLSVLIQAMAKVVGQDAEVYLTLIGSGTEQEALEKEIADFGLTRRVRFTGQITAPEMTTYLSQADIGVSPYCGRAEFSGLKLLDYKAAGLATIASGQKGQPSVLKHGETGWIVPPCDVDALAEAILKFTCDRELRRQIGRNARIEAEKYHSWFHTAQQLEQIFKQYVNSETVSSNPYYANYNS